MKDSGNSHRREQISIGICKNLLGVIRGIEFEEQFGEGRSLEEKGFGERGSLQENLRKRGRSKFAVEGNVRRRERRKWRKRCKKIQIQKHSIFFFFLNIRINSYYHCRTGPLEYRRILPWDQALTDAMVAL